MRSLNFLFSNSRSKWVLSCALLFVDSKLDFKLFVWVGLLLDFVLIVKIRMHIFIAIFSVFGIVFIAKLTKVKSFLLFSEVRFSHCVLVCKLWLILFLNLVLLIEIVALIEILITFLESRLFQIWKSLRLHHLRLEVSIYIFVLQFPILLLIQILIVTVTNGHFVHHHIWMPTWNLILVFLFVRLCKLNLLLLSCFLFNLLIVILIKFWLILDFFFRLTGKVVKCKLRLSFPFRALRGSWDHYTFLFNLILLHKLLILLLILVKILLALLYFLWFILVDEKLIESVQILHKESFWLLDSFFKELV